MILKVFISAALAYLINTNEANACFAFFYFNVARNIDYLAFRSALTPVQFHLQKLSNEANASNV